MKKYYFNLVIALAVLVIGGAGCLNVGDSGFKTSGPAGMFVSTDKGESWTMISTIPAVDGNKNISNVSVYTLSEDPSDAKGLYWASRQNGLYYSFDNGKSWQQADAPINSGFIRDVAVHPENKCIIYVSNGRQVFKTEDCARSWDEMFKEVRAKDNITSIAFDPHHIGDVYIAESNGDVLKSTDLGKNWAAVKRFENEYVRHIKFDSNHTDFMYISTQEDGLYRSKDLGKTWESLKNKLKEYPGALEMKRFLVYPGKVDTLYWVSKYGILTSRNAGEDWEPIELVTPPGTVDIYGFAVNPLNDKELFYTGTLDMKSTFYRSVDGGKTWETRKLPSKQIPTVLRAHPENSGWLYLGFTIPPEK